MHCERAMKISCMGRVVPAYYMSKQLGLGKPKGHCSFCGTRVGGMRKLSLSDEGKDGLIHTCWVEV